MDRTQLYQYLHEIHWNETQEAITLLHGNEHLDMNAEVSDEKQKLISQFICKHATEEAPLFNSCSLKIMRHCRFIASPLHNSELKMVYVLSGQVTIWTTEKDYLLHVGDLLVIPADLPHGDRACGENDIAVDLFLTRNYIHTMLALMSENQLFTPFFLEKERLECMVLAIGENDQIKTSMEQILCEYFEPELCSNSMITGMFAMLLNRIYRHVYSTATEKSAFQQSKNRDANLSYILQYLSTNFASLTLNSLAERFAYTPNYLGQLLIRQTGESFTELKQRYALQRACILLTRSDRPITELASEVGYTNVSYFYKVFKRNLGMSPSEYRKLNSVL